MIWLLVFAGVYLLVMLAAAWISLHPIRTPALMSPGMMGAPQESVEFDSDGAKLSAWWLEAEGAKTVVLLCHGYMMNRSELAPVAWQLWTRGYSCLMPDFRAHGRSGGRKCSLGNDEAKDVAAAVAYIRQRRPSCKVVLLGSSMGAAASAIALGSDPALADALVLDSAYSRLSSAIVGWWRFLGGPVLALILSPTVVIAAPLAGFNPYKVDISRCLTSAGPIPVLVFHGDRDNLALPSEARRNFDACTGPKTMVWFEGCRHCEGRWEEPEKYVNALAAFLAEHAL